MEKLVVEEICRNLKWYERVVVKLFRKTFIKVYHMGRILIFNRKLEDKRLSSSNKLAQF